MAISDLPDKSLILSETGSWATLHHCPEPEIDKFLLQLQSLPDARGWVFRVIRGHRCKTKKGLFQEWAAALQFPYYFGENWDAFDECLCDLEWLPADCHSIFVVNVDMVLAEHADKFQTFAKIVGEAIRSRRKENMARGAQKVGKPLRIVFHCAPEKRKDVRQRLARAGLEIKDR